MSSSHDQAATKPGVLFVTVNLQGHQERVSRQVLEDWYKEHIEIVLNCPSNGGLFLRYTQGDASIDVYDDPGFEAREKDPASSKASIARAGWSYLTLVKLTDIHWLSTPQFDAMPRTSDVLPRNEDGSVGSGFRYFHAGLRGYETITKGEGTSKGSGRPKWLLSLQIESDSKEALEEAAKVHGKEGCRSWIAYALRDGLLGYFEPGQCPRGLVLLSMDEEPQLGQVKGVLRRDVWKFTAEYGDLSLSL